MICAKYTKFANIFFLDLASKFFKYIRINNCTIKLVDGKQSSYRPIYSFRLIKLKTLKAYIKINPANNFIGPFKSPASAVIFFD